MIWILATLAAAGAQIGRNMAQVGLTKILGTLGATQVRFVYGLPFAVLFLALTCLWQGKLPPRPDMDALAWLVAGGIAQIGATALMLAAMQLQGLAVTTAILKTEPVLIAIGAALLAAEFLTPLQTMGVLVATGGVVITGWRKGAARGATARVALIGLAAALSFGLSAIFFRLGIVALGEDNYFLRALTALVISLTAQVAILALWLSLFHKGAMRATLGQWRGSLAAGFLGAFGSAMWFTAFSLAPAAQVRTLALVEVLFAALLAYALRGERPQNRQYLGMALIVAGVVALLRG